MSFYAASDRGLAWSVVYALASASAFSVTPDVDIVFANVAAGVTAFFDDSSMLTPASSAASGR
ncbi:MAG: hypothetical protein AAGL24_22710 [Pseudomonadota bacterium]